MTPGLPDSEPQFSIEVNGVEKYRLDLAVPRWKIAIEYDGEAAPHLARGPEPVTSGGATGCAGAAGSSSS